MNMTKNKDIKNARRPALPCKPGVDPEGNSKAIVIKHIPYGFFEKELLGYFLQFGTVRRVRLPRNKKTGNHKGWAFVLFTDCEVAQLAAEAMDGYLMFEKRLECKVIKNKDLPLCLCKGPRIIRPPLKNGPRKRHAKQLNKMQSGWCEETAKKRLLKNIKIRGNKFAEFGYQLPTVVGLSEAEQFMPFVKRSPVKVDEFKSDDTISQVEKPLKEKKSVISRATTVILKNRRR